MKKPKHQLQSFNQPKHSFYKLPSRTNPIDRRKSKIVDRVTKQHPGNRVVFQRLFTSVPAVDSGRSETYPSDDERGGEVRASHQPEPPVGLAALSPQRHHERMQPPHASRGSMHYASALNARTVRSRRYDAALCAQN